MLQKLEKLKTNFLFFLELQLLISIVILPILIAWGLPISLLSIAGNLIFAQFLTAFIFVATILFTCDLCGISNYWPTQILELITNIWHYLLSFGGPNWLVGFGSWILPISILFAIIACGQYYQRQIDQRQRIVILLTLCSLIASIRYFAINFASQTTVMQGNQKMYLVKVKGHVYAFDCGALGARACSQSWIEYTVAQAMIKKLGTTSIETLFLCKSNSRTPGAAQYLTEQIITNRVCIIQKNDAIDISNNIIDKKLQSIDFNS